jgi:hypothetical protein
MAVTAGGAGFVMRMAAAGLLPMVQMRRTTAREREREKERGPKMVVVG